MSEVNDPCLLGEINHYRREIRATRALRDLEAETCARQHKVSQEREVVEKVLKESMRRLEQAGVYKELLHCSHAAASLPIPPHTMPLIPCRNGPVEMPILAGEEDSTWHHVVSKTPKWQHNKKCSYCGSHKHQSKQCLLGGANPVFSMLNQEKMTLTKHIALMDKPDWAPTLCKKCFGHNLGHKELDFPNYKQCQRCYSFRTQGFIHHHACHIQAEEDEDMDFSVDDDVYQGCE